MRAFLKTWPRTIAVAALAGAICAGFAWVCLRDSTINFLAHHSRGRWIIFPSAVDTLAHPVANLDATFRRAFVLENRPHAAEIKIAACKQFQIDVNGVLVDRTKTNNWKDISTIDVASVLRAGENIIEVRVLNNDGPPCLWLVLTADALTMPSNNSWQASLAGSAWRPAAYASIPRFPGRGNPAAVPEKMSDSVAAAWPLWLGFALIGATILAITARAWDRHRFTQALSGKPQLALLFIAGLWVLLFWNNSRWIPLYAGFDARSHLEYIRYIQEQRTLPLPNQGFETYQPPFYYALSAGVLSICRLSIDQTAAFLVLRFLTMSFGIAHFVFIFLSLCLLFPGQPRLQVVGLILAAFVPMQIYLSHYVTNESLVAALAAAAIYFALRVVIRKQSSLSDSIGLGAFLGVAVLTKATAILLLPAVAGALAMKLIANRSGAVSWVRTLIVPLSVCFLLSGWYYCWVWARFGTPLVGNWNVTTGFAWWQDPGYHVTSDFIRFGRSLVHPLLSGLAGIPDGVYSTLWGDGLWGGLSDAVSRTPWNYSLMIGGYLLALAPAALILIGAGSALRRFLQRPSTEWFLLLGFCVIIASAFLFLTLKVASYAQIKAFYMLSALLPLCSVFVLGWDLLARRHRFLEFICALLLFLWATNSYASMWVRNSATTHAYNAERWAFEKKPDRAFSEAEKSVEIDPSNETAHRVLSVTAASLDKLVEANEQARRAVDLAPENSDVHRQFSAVLLKEGNVDQATTEARRAIILGPENPGAYQMLFTCLRQSQRDNEAVNVGRDALAVSPFDAEMHYRLGLAAGKIGDFATASDQFAYAMLLRPQIVESEEKLKTALAFVTKTSAGLLQLKKLAFLAVDSPKMLNDLAWLLATNSDSWSRDGAEAVRLAERACALTHRRDPQSLATLAAAYAEIGKFSEATMAAQQSIRLAESTGESSIAALGRDLLVSFQASQPYRTQP